MKRKLFALLLALCMLLTACGQQPDNSPAENGQTQTNQGQEEQTAPPDDGFSTSVSGRVEDPEGLVTETQKQLMTRLLIALFGAQAFWAIGLADDAARLRSRAQLGLRRLPRLALEAAAAAAVLVLLAVNGCLPTGLQLPGAGYVELGGAAPVLWGLVLVALAECARTADGADGTVCGTAFAAMLGLMMLETRLGWFPLAVLPAALAGALLAFLLWNFPPAKLRPGSCGCLYLAGVLGCVPLCIGYAELSIPLALPFWAEGGMVLLQILYHRITGRPLFRAAPLHRWLEARGAGPVTVFYWLCALGVCGLALALAFVR